MSLFKTCKPLIGVVHLPPLPGSPGYMKRSYPTGIGKTWSIEEIYEYAKQEAKKYENAGFDAVIIENFGDKPYSIRATPGQIAAMTGVVREVARVVNIPVGVSLLRNSPYESIYVALAGGAKFIRVNNLCEYRVSPEGVLEPSLQELARAVSELNLYETLTRGEFEILVDIDVKHSWPLIDEYSVSHVMIECLDRAGIPISAIVVTGPKTGVPPDKEYLNELKTSLKPFKTKLVIGSGISSENISEYWRFSDGFIVGTSIKLGGETENVVSVDKAKRLADIVARYREVWPCAKTR